MFGADFQLLSWVICTSNSINWNWDLCTPPANLNHHLHSACQGGPITVVSHWTRICLDLYLKMLYKPRRLIFQINKTHLCLANFISIQLKTFSYREIIPQFLFLPVQACPPDSLMRCLQEIQFNLLYLSLCIPPMSPLFYCIKHKWLIFTFKDFHSLFPPCLSFLIQYWDASAQVRLSSTNLCCFSLVTPNMGILVTTSSHYPSSNCPLPCCLQRSWQK